jgi:carbonic anhydrase
MNFKNGDVKIHGIDEEKINNLPVDAHEWFEGFDHVEDSVKSSVDLIENHPLLPDDIPVHGLVIDPKTGKLDIVINGY